MGVVVLRLEAVLLVRRGRAPGVGQWSLPGGAQELGEPVEQTARRELLEETAVRCGALHLLTHIDGIHRDAAGRVQYHYTILDFASCWLAGEPVAGDDVMDAAFASLDALEPFALSLDVLRVIGLARARLDLG